MSILIRSATAHDEPALLELLATAYAFHADGLPSLFREPGGEFLLKLLRREDLRHVVAELEGEVAGLAQFSLETTGATPIKPARRFVAVLSVQVAPAYRRQGVGRALMEHVQAWAREQGATHVELNVYEFNEPALEMYRELGYSTVSRMLKRPV